MPGNGSKQYSNRTGTAGNRAATDCGAYGYAPDLAGNCTDLTGNLTGTGGMRMVTTGYQTDMSGNQRMEKELMDMTRNRMTGGKRAATAGHQTDTTGNRCMEKSPTFEYCQLTQELFLLRLVNCCWVIFKSKTKLSFKMSFVKKISDNSEKTDHIAETESSSSDDEYSSDSFSQASDESEELPGNDPSLPLAAIPPPNQDSNIQNTDMIPVKGFSPPSKSYELLAKRNGFISNIPIEGIATFDRDKFVLEVTPLPSTAFAKLVDIRFICDPSSFGTMAT
ncbi:hypothetical protein HDU67_003443 [Dinochytrium kinnereticum]|nr:hypothetical protein HDU67_003443 [Dinochytrium kinnereticum]